jgi:UDP:flavonoid glycosyltransferase YjiC (YdhE family)
LAICPKSNYQESIQAATQLNRRAVLLMGENKFPENLPKNIIATNYAPYSKILKIIVIAVRFYTLFLPNGMRKTIYLKV